MTASQLPEPSHAQRLNRSCFCTSVDIPQLQQWLERDLAKHGLSRSVVATHPNLFSASPVFVSAEHVAQIRQIIGAIEATISLEAYQETVLATAPPVAQAKPAARGGLLSYDFHLTAAGPVLIEINTNAGGAMLNAMLSRAQRACCPEVEHFVREQHDSDALENALFDLFAEEWRLSRGSAAPKSIAIVDDAPEEQYLYPEFLLFQRLFEARGIRCVTAAAQTLEYAGGTLSHKGLDIDLVYNRLTDFYFADAAHASLRHAYTSGAAVVTSHPHAHALYANKHNLALLTDEQALRTLGVATAASSLLLRGIPRTEAIAARSSEEWWDIRKLWFFKPAGGYGSRGSYRGDKLTRKTFAAIMEGDYVAQALVPPSERWLAGGPGDRPFKLDLRCYVYAGRILSIAARLYQGQTTNMRTPGGGFAPVYVTPASG